ncbi:MAG TPA: alpha/beta fold hydrolase [Mycobacteriales bacterium]|nr:alpha/beta fold hydrolase [Mycobacteriales bacterium]
MTSWRRVEVDGCSMRVMEAGEGEPLVFLHGWGLSPRTYEQGITRLTAGGVRVIAPALPGFGGSDGPPLLRIDLKAYSRRIAGLIDALALEEPVFLVGHSFGGGVALQLATDRPDLVRSLTLVNTVGGAPGRRTGMADSSWLRWMLGALTELHPRALAGSLPSLVRSVVPNLARRPVTLALTAYLALTVDLVDQARALVASGMPVLFVWGDQDRLVLPGALRSVEGALPAEVVHGRHGWLLTEPEEFATILRDALVVHAMLERKRRGQSMRFPAGMSLAELIPPERRTHARHEP